jgi:hypothetical protein
MLLLLNQNFYKWRTTSRVWCVDFHRYGVFIGVQGGVTDLVKLVTHQVVASTQSLATCPGGDGVQPPPTFSFRFPVIASWRVSPRSQLMRGCKVGPATPWDHLSTAFAHYLLVSGTFSG